MTMHTVSVKLPDGERLIVTGRSPWIKYLFTPGPIGEHARWLVHNKDERTRAAVNGWERVIPGPWPFGLRMAALPTLTWQRRSVPAEAAGWAFTAWIIAKILRG